MDDGLALVTLLSLKSKLIILDRFPIAIGILHWQWLVAVLGGGGCGGDKHLKEVYEIGNNYVILINHFLLTFLFNVGLHSHMYTQ